MVSKKEYRDRRYLLMGLLIGGALGFSSSFAAGSYFTLHPEWDIYLFSAAFGGFWIVMGFGYYMVYVLDKKSK